MNTYLYDLVYIHLHPGTITISRETISGGDHLRRGFCSCRAPWPSPRWGATALRPWPLRRLGLGIQRMTDLNMGNIGVLDGF